MRYVYLNAAQLGKFLSAAQLPTASWSNTQAIGDAGVGGAARARVHTRPVAARARALARLWARHAPTSLDAARGPDMLRDTGQPSQTRASQAPEDEAMGLRLYAAARTLRPVAQDRPERGTTPRSSNGQNRALSSGSARGPRRRQQQAPPTIPGPGCTGACVQLLRCSPCSTVTGSLFGFRGAHPPRPNAAPKLPAGPGSLLRATRALPLALDTSALQGAQLISTNSAGPFSSLPTSPQGPTYSHQPVRGP